MTQKNYLRTYTNDHLLQIAMPIGGIGAGCICLNGYAGLIDFSIRNKPATTALPDGHHTCDSAFALLHIKGDAPVTRLIEGPFPPGRIYDQGLKAQGMREGGHEGLPRFQQCAFHAAYPFGHVQLSDSHIPLDVAVTAFNPFIPLDDENSGIPCAILEYTFTNRTGQPVQFEFSYHLSHLAAGASDTNRQSKQDLSRTTVLPGFGVSFTNTDAPTAESFGSAAFGVVGHQPKIKGNWFRGGWFDGISAIWREASTGKFTTNNGNPDQDSPGRNGASILVDLTLPPGQSTTIPIIIAWYFPNVGYEAGALPKPAASLPIAPDCGPDCACDAPKWRPYYVSQWKNAADVANYVKENLPSLRARTQAFADALYSSTIPPEILDAVGSNLAILKSPTVLRQENGNLWAWEGCFTGAGCCHGSCTHVWNYAQAMPHLFPNLERTLREQEFVRSMDERGHINFRSALPDGPTTHTHHAAADGQLGGIMKLYRDWQISGDRAWLASLYPLAQQSLEYCIATWDPDHLGALFEPHHNTYDIEFWGPDGMCASIYIGALSAAAKMARELGKPQTAEKYEQLAQRGAALMDESLFNGEYFFQQVRWRDLRDQHYIKMLTAANPDDPAIQLLVAEGPKYQYGTGCLSDGVIGAWFAAIYGIDTPLTNADVRGHLKSVFTHNFKPDLFEHACAQRPGYAMGHEPGLLLCTWPRGGKPTLPFVYSDEVWTGIEYQVASHLFEEGFIQEGLQIVRAVRSRYDGKVRNPFNEYECGSYYARAMASYALLASLAGLRYSAVTRQLTLSPKLPQRPLKIFFSTATAFGTLTIDQNEISIDLTEGELKIDILHLQSPGNPAKIDWHQTITAGKSSTRQIPTNT